MRLTAVFLLAVSLHVAATGLSQKVTLNVKNAPLKTVFVELNKQTGYNFLYADETLAKASAVTLKVKDVSLADVLALCFKDQPLGFTIENNSIVIKSKIANPTKEGEATSPDIPLTTIDVKGRVTNENNEPVPGASIKVKGTTNGTTTNANGEFTLTGVDENATLVFSGTNIETFEKKIGSTGDLGTITARIKIAALNEVIVNKGYYTEKQKFSVGNVGRVTAAEIEKQPVQNPLLALQGRVPGLVVTQNNGMPGGGVTVRIQGQNSIAVGNDPLIVIDGVPYFSQLPSTGADGILGSSGGVNLGGVNTSGSPLSYINPSDIESIEVLKDADATAIFGSRAANGAILITTKKGKAGQTKVSFNVQQGWGKVTRKIDMLNTRQYLDMRYEALKNDNININTLSSTNTAYSDLKVWDTTRYTDWQKELIGGTALYTNVNASISGGNSNTQFLVSGTYNKQTTVFPGNFADQKGSVHFSVTNNSQNQKFRLQLSANYMVDNNELPQTDLTQNAVQLAPNAPAIYNPDGTLNWAQNSLGNSTWTNPLIYTYTRYKNLTNNLVSNANFGYRIIKGLELKSSFGYTNTQTEDLYMLPLISIAPERRNTSQRTANYGSRKLNSWVIEPQISYYTKISKGKIDFLLGGTLTQYDYKAGSILGTGYNSDEVLENIQAAATVRAGGQAIGQYKYNALFTRLNYNWEEKYILNITARRDGSSRFGKKTQLHNFGSVGAAWIISEEGFMKQISFINFAKLRASYGTTGNDQMEDYAPLSLYGNVGNQGLPYQNTTGLLPNNLSNPKLEWEETRKFQTGIDLAFFKDRIIFGATYVQNRSSNQLMRYSLPSFVGFPNIRRNFPATVQNTSWEFSLQTINFKNADLNWTTRFNLTIPRNEVVDFPNIQTSTYANSLVIGEPLGIIRMYRFAGVDPSTGKYLFFTGQGGISPNPSSSDRTFVNFFPSVYGGFENTISYKEFEISALFQFVKQKGMNYFFYNGIAFPGEFFSFASNQPVEVLNRWQKPGDIATIARFSTTATQFNAVSSDYFYTDASYARLKNLSLSWEVPVQLLKKINMQRAKVYMQGQNLITITNYKGLDPENQGTASLPPLKIVTVGVQISF